jgi:hypothetical protein
MRNLRINREIRERIAINAEGRKGRNKEDQKNYARKK